ncbi:MAG: ATPase [Thermoleophilia bacterium]|nr:ATPase [Thermoleophilia bacterium]
MTESTSGTDAVSLAVGVAYDPVKPLFNATRIERGLTHLRTERFPVVDDCVAALQRLDCRVTHSERDYDGETSLLCELVDGTLLYVYLDAHDRNAYVSVGSPTHDRATVTLTRVVDGLRRADTDDASVALRLWSLGQRGPTFTRRVFDAPAFEDVRTNYPKAVRAALRGMFEVEQSAIGGLALWYGPPGTGKTTAVRALARAWRSWCDVHVVVDPEALMRDPNYLMGVITARSFEEDLPVGAVRAERRSRLIVLEDAGELLAADARASTGQGLSRILNVTDGLLGRGIGTSILITTNEEIGSLHPAIRRPGRCWNQLRFGRFSGREARDWLAAKDVDRAGVAGSRSLAELFAIERGEMIEEARVPFGFQA